MADRYSADAESVQPVHLRSASGPGPQLLSGNLGGEDLFDPFVMGAITHKDNITFYRQGPQESRPGRDRSFKSDFSVNGAGETVR